MAVVVLPWSVVPAFAADPISIRVGGYSKWWVVGTWGQNEASSAPSPAVKGDNEIHFVGTTRLDNGLKVGIKTELEAGGHTDQSTDPIDKAFAWVEGGFGKLELGTDYNAASLLHVSAPEAAGLWNGPPSGLMSDTVIRRPSTVSTMYSGNQTELDQDDNAEKILYFTPRLGGLTLGLSYTPSALSEDNRGPLPRSDLYAVGVGYTRTVGGVGIAFSAGYVGGDLKPGGVSGEKVWAYSLGGTLSYAGVTVGGSWADENHRSRSGCVSGDCLDNSGQAWDVGAMYETERSKISLDYYTSRVIGLVSDKNVDRISIYQISEKYTLGEGVAVMGAVGYINYQDESGRSNRGYSAMTGLGLWF